MEDVMNALQTIVDYIDEYAGDRQHLPNDLRNKLKAEIAALEATLAKAGEESDLSHPFGF